MPLPFTTETVSLYDANNVVVGLDKNLLPKRVSPTVGGSAVPCVIERHATNENAYVLGLDASAMAQMYADDIWLPVLKRARIVLDSYGDAWSIESLVPPRFEFPDMAHVKLSLVLLRERPQGLPISETVTASLGGRSTQSNA